MFGVRIVAPLVVAALSSVGCSEGQERPTADGGVVTKIESGTQAPPAVAVALGPSKAEVTVEVDHPGDGQHILTGEGEIGGDLAQITFDGTGAPNAAGFFGHHDSFEVIYSPEGLTAHVLPERWVEISLDSASSFVGADIARLRDLVLVNPLLLKEALGSSDLEPGAGDVVLTADDTEVVAELEKLYGLDELALTLDTDDEGNITMISGSPVYELVRDTEAIVTLRVVWEFQPLSSEPEIELPDPKVVDTL